MPLFRNLINSSISAASLSLFLSENIQSFYDLHNSSIVNLNAEKQDIREFIETKSLLLERLDFTSNINKSFISILFDFSERFGFLSIVRIENTIVRHDLNLGARREAAKLFLLNIRNNDAYLDRFNDICTLLQSALESEEDTDKDVIVSFLNYFAKVVGDTSLQYVEALKEKIILSKAALTYAFLQSRFISRLLEIGLVNLEATYNLIHDLIDEIYERPIGVVAEVEIADELLLESNTEYANLLSRDNFTFDFIRQIAVNRSTWDSHLSHRGVLPLESESEMFTYLKSLGLMHNGDKIRVTITRKINL